MRGFLVQASRVALSIEQLERRHAERERERLVTGHISSDVGSAIANVVSLLAPPTSATAFAASAAPAALPATPLPQKTLPPTPLPMCAALPSMNAVAPGGVADLVGATAAQLMGFYLLSSVLLMRASLPREFRRGIQEAAGDLEFEFYHHFFDAIFLASFLIAGFIKATFQAYVARRRVARRLEQSVGSAVADQIAGVRRHDHAVQVAAQRLKAFARTLEAHEDAHSSPESTEAQAPQAAVARMAAEAACAAEGRREGLLDFAAARLFDFDERLVKEHDE